MECCWACCCMPRVHFYLCLQPMRLPLVFSDLLFLFLPADWLPWKLLHIPLLPSWERRIPVLNGLILHRDLTAWGVYWVPRLAGFLFCVQYIPMIWSRLKF